VEWGRGGRGCRVLGWPGPPRQGCRVAPDGPGAGAAPVQPPAVAGLSVGHDGSRFERRVCPKWTMPEVFAGAKSRPELTDFGTR